MRQRLPENVLLVVMQVAFLFFAQPLFGGGNVEFGLLGADVGVGGGHFGFVLGRFKQFAYQHVE